MASRIKGITVEIGGDTSGPEKSLSDVNNAIKKTQSQLRDMNSLRKLNPSNFIPLAQKQEILQQAIGDKVKIDYLQQNVSNRMVTSADKPLQKVLSIQFRRVSDALKEVDEYLKDIDKCCNQRYDWEKQRKQIHSNYVNIFEAWNFEKEFKEEA